MSSSDFLIELCRWPHNFDKPHISAAGCEQTPSREVYSVSDFYNTSDDRLILLSRGSSWGALGVILVSAGQCSNGDREEVVFLRY